MDHDDHQLLRQYAQHASQEAFAAIVKHHVDMVYSAALRQVRDPAKAEDVTQAVFIVLSRKAAAISARVLLAGWLLNTVRFVVSDLNRKDRRRKHHEREAAQMVQQQRRGSTDSVAAWEQLAPDLDDALASLGTRSRDGIVMKFFEGKTGPEVAAHLGISEEAARKRVSRAIEELRTIFAGKGIAIPSALLGEVMAIELIKSAPAGLASASASAAALTGPTAVSSNLAGGAIKLMTLAKIKAVAAFIAVTTVIATASVVTVSKVASQPAPAQPSSDVVLASADAPRRSTIAGVVRAPDGKPLSGASVFLATEKNRINIYDKRIQSVAPIKTAADGKYSLIEPAENYQIIVVANEGYAEPSSVALKKSTDITIRPWASIDGVVMDGAKPVPNVEVMIWRYFINLPWGGMTYQGTNTRTDAAGRFKFPRVAPGEIWVGRSLNPGVQAQARWAYLVTDPGQTHKVTVGAEGRPVIGKFVAPAGATPIAWSRAMGTHLCQLSLGRRNEGIAQPQFTQEDPEEAVAARQAWGRTPNGHLVNTWQFFIEGTINPEGTFRFSDIPPGDYEVTIGQSELNTEAETYETVATARRQFTVPAMPEKRSDTAFDLGSIECTMAPRFAPGHAMPELELALPDGKSWKLSQRDGKPTVILLWHSGDLPGLGERARVIQKWVDAKVIRAIGIDVSAPTDLDALARIASDQKLSWPLVSSGPEPLAAEFQGPATTAIIIDGVGRLVQWHIYKPETIDKLIRRAVAASAPGDLEL